MTKLYCYVDETGQDTAGQLFIVGAVVVGREREQIRALLHRIERTSGKDKKWAHSRVTRREAYLSALFSAHPIGLRLFYTRFTDTTDYLTCIAHTIARALAETSEGQPYRATVLVDGLNKKEQHRLGTALRRLGVSVEKVRGLRDEADEFIRLADATAGFARDHSERQSYSIRLYEEAATSEFITEV